MENNKINNNVYTQNNIFVSFSEPYKLKLNNRFFESCYLSACSYFTKINEFQDYSKIIEVLEFLNIRNLFIVTVTKNPEYYNITKKYIQNENSIINNIFIPWKIFFKQRGINNFLLNPDFEVTDPFDTSFDDNNNVWNRKKIRPGFIIYKFEETTWFEIVYSSKKLNVNISGGSERLRHTTNPTALRMYLFLIALERANIFNKVSNSYYITSKLNKNESKVLFDLNDKEVWSFLKNIEEKMINDLNQDIKKTEAATPDNKNTEAATPDNKLNNYNNSNKSNNSNNINNEPNNNNNNNNNIKSNNNNPFNSKEQKRDFHSTINLLNNKNKEINLDKILLNEFTLEKKYCYKETFI
jgi:hypothetical protein